MGAVMDARSTQNVETREDDRRFCPTGKARYSTEADALDSLVRVRRDRSRKEDPRPHESHLYPCERCKGYHLSSSPVLIADGLLPEREQWNGESMEAYAKRLERRIAEQRGQILSMLAVGNGGNNRETRKRIGSLTVALGRVTDLWDQERRNREALVERLNEYEARPRRRWLRSVGR